MSKDKFDFHCYGHPVTPDPLTNTIKGFRQFEKWMKTAVSHVKQEVLIVMEYTGIYTYNIERFLNDKGWSYVKRPGLDIKRSVGMQRGKTDSADARMISKYGWMNKEILKPTKPVKDSLVELQQLMSYRDKLVADKASYQVRFKELSEQMGNKFSKTMGRSIQHVLTLLTKEIHEIEEAIQQCVARDEQVHKNYNLLRTISGIGFVTAVSLIITTENFTRFSDHRKFACYCGVAPFMYRSGSSIRGKTRVSHLANKKIKSLLTMCVLTAVRTDAGLKAKYDQKCKEQKPKMSVINIIRAKLIERIFAVINRQTPYLKMAA